MLAVRIDAETEARLDSLARSRRSSKSDLVREAIARLLEDQEDAALAEKVLDQECSSKSLAQLRKQLGLDG